MQTEYTLQPKMFIPLPLGSIQPRGWLQKQLQIQADGLSGHLDEFWNDITNSGWIGGDAEGWERAPYWLDGLVPLAYGLNDERLKAKVQRWFDYILEHQQADGWLGPLHDTTYGYMHDPWPIFIVLKAMTQYYEATSDTRVIVAMERCLHRLQALLQQQPLMSWAQLRASEVLLSIYWLYEHSQEAWLLDLAHVVQEQAFDWTALYQDFPFKERQPTWTAESHVVNNAMALKEPAVVALLTWNKQAHQEVEQRIHTLDTYHGQVTGVFTGDEVLAGKNPSQGTELCAVVEYLFSLEQLLAIYGDSAFADRLERIVYNALPATFKPDMWAHQYDQQVNQVLCTPADDHIYTTNGPDANLFGLEPNFGCCTANMHQGWPKFTSHLWMRSADQGLVVLAYAPCAVAISIADVPVFINVETRYPFEESIQITVRTERAISFPLLLHIPGWTNRATIEIAGKQEIAQAGSFHRIERQWSTPLTFSLHLSMPLKTQTRYNKSVTLERGPLVYSLPINEEWRQIWGELPHATWTIHPTSPWNYALDLDRVHPELSVQIVTISNFSEQPFSPEGAPIQLLLTGCRLSSWEVEHNAAAPVPGSPVSTSEPAERLILIPYGCTSLRVTEFPTTT